MAAKWWIHRLFDREVPVEVSENDGIRYLHLGSSTVQSAMKIADPNELVLSYTRAMMGFLLFSAQPRHAVMIGLGGGSLAKFLYHRLPEVRVTVVENNPRVIRIARQFFAVPEDDARLRVELSQGEAWVKAHPGNCDVLMVDGFDGHSQVDALSTEDFYASARAALDPRGILVVNLWSSDKRFDAYLQRIERCFDANALIPAERRGNVIALGFCGKPRELRWPRLAVIARNLERRYDLEFRNMLSGLRELNPHNDKGLRF